MCEFCGARLSQPSWCAKLIIVYLAKPVDVLLYQLSLCSDYSEYKHKFEHGLDMYLEGNWKEARQELSECLALWEADKPCQVILDFMAEHQNMKPLNWDGYRALTEK